MKNYYSISQTVKKNRFLSFLALVVMILSINIGLTSCSDEDDDVPSIPEEEEGDLSVTEVATGLDTPWQIAFAPDGRMFITERQGRIRVVENGTLRQEPYLNLRDSVLEAGEAGLTGIAIDPDFESNGYMYFAYSYEESRSPLEIRNKLVRYREVAETGSPVFDMILLEGIEGYINHNGGPLHFGPDGKLYWPVGERYIPEYAQDLDNYNGSILRLNNDGSVPDDNPFPESHIYTYGHRNSQGLAWQPGTNNLFNTEHGPSEAQGCCLDEINLIEAGKNYGWPEIRGAEEQEGMEIPVAYSGDTVTWAPALATFVTSGTWEGSMLFTGLYGEALYRVVFDTEDPTLVVEIQTYLQGRLGRLRAIAEGPDGNIYISTSNGDGRGIAKTPDDDRILIVNLP